MAFGSCFWDYPNQALTIFDSIRAERAEVFVMAGDNCYYGEPDWQSEQAMMLAQLRHRNNDPLRRLLAETPVLAIWDDHDFGPNDSDARFVGEQPDTRRKRRQLPGRRHAERWRQPGGGQLYGHVHRHRQLSVR